MLNEYEISAFACWLDHINWKIDDVVFYDEGAYLNEFPANFGVEIGQDCKQFIVFLIIMTFAIKVLFFYFLESLIFTLAISE